MLRHPLVALIHRSRHYRVLIGGFVLRMTGAYTATLAAVWGAWKYGSPARADVGRAIAMLAIAAFVLYQQDLLFRVAIDTPGMYAVAAGTAGLLLATGIVAATFGLVIGWGCAYGIQGCRPLFAWAPRPGAASGLSIALMTVATATGAPVVVELLGHLGPAVVLIGGSLILGAVFSPDVHGAAGAAATATATGSGSGSGRS